ncbi:preprotein translocase subunit SecA [Stieleria neptunia]|uniref:Protein translocase subunit SecA n=2 Tax=Stieleria neptunia TaxID=2527979 RepID=A0A518HWW9_9BACT|nr:preprotein translocase subunit SecA [Stieleria neptunia]QDV45358.1 preprotein translocase subunit SecA [Stieleria neptunia]
MTDQDTGRNDARSSRQPDPTDPVDTQSEPPTGSRNTIVEPVSAPEPVSEPEQVAEPEPIAAPEPVERKVVQATEIIPADKPRGDAGTPGGASSTPPATVAPERFQSVGTKSMSIFSGGGFHPKMVRWKRMLTEINELEPTLQPESDNDLRKRSLALRYRAMAGEKLAKLLPEAYALVREAGRRTLGMRHYDVQMIGGISLFESHIAEMQTGEGKTLTATLPLYLHSLVGKGAHLATVNDYLAKRDAEWMTPIYNLLGVSVGIIQTPDDQGSRRKSYGSAVTYGTAKEFGFDFLRDRLLLRAQNRIQTEMLGDGGGGFSDSGDKPVMRGMHFCLVDEADSILIDEARTPLIIGSLEDTVRDQIVETYRWASEHAPEYELDDHFTIDDDTKQYELTARGRQKVRALPKSNLVRTMGLVDLYEYTERAVKVFREFLLDRQYVVRPGDKGVDEIVIVDEFTGRLAEGRKWRDGIHQAIEAKENIEISVPTGQAARITVQDLFLRYNHLAGMTGTAATSARELKRIYRTPVLRVPTNRPPKRKRLADRVFGSIDAKFQAIVDEVKTIHETGRPVLIGTRSIDKSELLSRMLQAIGIEHQILNANNVAMEAEIVADAGQHGRVTVATNMAGRGTDIKLTDQIVELGGMHVICTELHDAARIDRQLIGRCGRQGDPGSYRQYLSLDDDILKGGLGPDKAEKLKARGESLTDSVDSYAKLFRRAQRKVEKKHFRDRMVLLHHEKERKKMQREIGQDPYLDTPD